MSESKVSAPILIKIISWLLLIGGVLSLFIVLPLFLFGTVFISLSVFLIGFINLSRAVGMIAVSFGLRKMKLWAFYTYVVLTGLSILTTLYSYITDPTFDTRTLVLVAIQILVLVYFWSIRKKFA